MSNKERKSQLWHDFVLGIHKRAISSIEEGSWTSWNDAATQYYGKQYKQIYKNYHELLEDGIINE